MERVQEQILLNRLRYNMNLRQYLALFSFGTLIAATSFIMVLYFVDPFATGLIGAIIFYITLLCALIGLFTTLGTAIRAKRNSEEGIETHISRSLRQAILFTALIISSLILQSIGKLTTFSVFLLIAIFGLLEFLSLGRKTTR